ncbi:MAG: AtpZ/AtpI family protein [Polymorphobacter sp.]
MDSPRTTDELEAFEARLVEARERIVPTADPRVVASSALAQGSRYALEIVAGTAVGGFLGWQLDRWLGTKPWLALLFLLLGLVAGFMNLLRAVNREAAIVNAEPVPPGVAPDQEGQ